MELKDKVVVITGAGGVICSEFAIELGKRGAKVALLGRTLSKLDAVKDKIGDNAKSYQCNVLDKAKLIEVKKQINQDFGPVDILINGAGGNSKDATCEEEFFNDLGNDAYNFFKLDEQAIDNNLRLNFMGTFLPSQVFSEDMIGKENCSILNVSSMNAYRPLTKIPAYSAGKAAMQNFTEWLAVYFAKTGIRVNAMAPGFLSTNQNKHLLYNEKGELSARAHKIINNTPMGRFGEVNELVGTLLFLLDSDASGFITGVSIPIDGGFNAYSGV